jgi:hypothetical protein
MFLAIHELPCVSQNINVTKELLYKTDAIALLPYNLFQEKSGQGMGSLISHHVVLCIVCVLLLQHAHVKGYLFPYVHKWSSQRTHPLFLLPSNHLPPLMSLGSSRIMPTLCMMKMPNHHIVTCLLSQGCVVDVRRLF